MLARGLDPLGPIKPSAEGRTLGIFGTPSHSPRSHREDPFSLGRILPINLTTELLLENQKLNAFPWTKHHSLWRPGTWTWSLPVFHPPNHMESLGSLPWQKGAGLGGLPGNLQSCRVEGIPWVSGGVRGLEEGEGVERPPSFSPDQGEEMQVH